MVDLQLPMVLVFTGDPAIPEMSAKDSMVSRHQKPLSEMAAVIEALEVAKLVGMKKLLIYTDSKFLSQDHVLYKLNNCDGITGDNCNKLKHLLELTNGCDVKFKYSLEDSDGGKNADCLAREGALVSGIANSIANFLRK